MPKIFASFQRVRDVDLSTCLDLREGILPARGGNSTVSQLVHTAHKNRVECRYGVQQANLRNSGPFWSVFRCGRMGTEALWVNPAATWSPA